MQILIAKPRVATCCPLIIKYITYNLEPVKNFLSETFDLSNSDLSLTNSNSSIDLFSLSITNFQFKPSAQLLSLTQFTCNFLFFHKTTLNWSEQASLSDFIWLNFAWDSESSCSIFVHSHSLFLNLVENFPFTYSSSCFLVELVMCIFQRSILGNFITTLTNLTVKVYKVWILLGISNQI